MNIATAPTLEDAAEADGIDAVVDLAIRRFLDGEDDGNVLLEALYGATLDEPVPARLLALVRGR